MTPQQGRPLPLTEVSTHPKSLRVALSARPGSESPSCGNQLDGVLLSGRPPSQGARWAGMSPDPCDGHSPQKEHTQPRPSRRGQDPEPAVCPSRKGKARGSRCLPTCLWATEQSTTPEASPTHAQQPDNGHCSVWPQNKTTSTDKKQPEEEYLQPITEGLSLIYKEFPPTNIYIALTNKYRSKHLTYIDSSCHHNHHTT